MTSRNAEERDQTQPNEDRTQGSIRTYNRWQLFYLDRLHRLYDLNKQADLGHLDEDQVRLLRRAIFFTLLDCEFVGVGEDAKQVISVDQ
ncbi:MAG: hypothetical protein M3Q29_24810 [Chloroflexota bacterium]|nr:hypothetical protein [Chloroflexota bacterium]